MELVINYCISSAPTSITRAERLMELAEKQEEDSGLLLGCAILLLASALDQALMTHLRNLSNFYKTVEQIDDMDNPAEQLLRESFWNRILKTPEISNNVRYRLNHRSPYYGFLRDLINRRNQLMHIEEHPIELVLDLGENIDIEKINITGCTTVYDPNLPTSAWINPDGVIHVNFNTKEIIDNTWNKITPAEARRSLAAVNLYNDHVILGPTMCELLIPMDMSTSEH
jgi:hypothetical protein